MSISRMEISGVVQGVGFRPFVFRIAKKLGLKGYVRNLGDAGVDIEIEGNKEKILRFLDLLKNEKPINSRIEKLDVAFLKNEKGYDEFKIMQSGGTGLGGIIPADVSTCDKCIKEIFNKENKRYRYPFTTCTDCGPRFTTIENVPYDRINTAFKKFPICKECRKEYSNPENRRFHAENIACPECGPRYLLLNKNGKEISNPIDNAIKSLVKGKILAIKGIGGMHIASKTSDDKTIDKLGKRLRRWEQPFAIISTLEMARTFSIINKKEKELLMSKERPIVVLRKSNDYWLSEKISPGLDSIGVLLPYTGLHHVLFQKLKEPLVMTSANFHGEPIILENGDILRLGICDLFLLHNLKIVNRCDDSVIKIVNDKQVFIRRSRGFVPFPVKLENKSRINVLALGAEENVTICLLKENDAFLSQYIGNTTHINTLEFLEDSVYHLLKITNTRPDFIACDLHPGFNTTKLGKELSRKFKIPLVQIQHHYSHSASLIAESNSNLIVTICCDGFGYGLDEKAWGGEIILYKDKKFERIGHLKEQRMPGGDIAVYYPARMATGILYNSFDENELRKILIKNKLYFKHGNQEIKTILRQLKKDINVPRTTSTGRVLDAISSLLSVCHYRSYEGEPAMKLEAIGNKGKREFDFPISIRDGILDTTKILERVLELKEDGNRIEDIAFSAESAIAEGLTVIALDIAKKENIGFIGISGGVAYNNVIVKRISEIVNEKGFEFIQHEKVPCGDGGISLGQVRYVLNTRK